MRRTHLLLIAPLLATALSGADAAELLAKARAAFEHNQKLEMHWNWTRTESRTVVDSSGKTLQELPGVTIESTVKSDGRRCEAVLAWSDGVEAYKVRADSDERCEATESTAASTVKVAQLLKTRKAKVTSQSAKGIALEIMPDKDLLRSQDHDIRCAASIRAQIVLDPATFFPRRVTGTVTELGCDRREDPPPTYYGEKVRGPVRPLFHKGASFQLEYELQNDKFQNATRSYWARTREHGDTPRWHSGGFFIYWGRSVKIESTVKGQRMVEDYKLTAQEFGVESRIIP
jgi:hypothetical protein